LKIKWNQVLLVGVLLSFLFLTPSIRKLAFSDGLFEENLPPASVGDRQAGLFVKINPPILTSDSARDAYALFRLFDEKTNQTIEHTTYQISITKGSSPDQRPLVNDFFHAHNGVLKLKVEPKPGELTILGNRDPFQDALVADPGGNILIRGPLLLEGGIYHFQIEIFGIDNDRNIFKPEDAPKFDSYLSVGDVFRENLTYNAKVYNATLISYYDKIQNFNFEASKLVASWEMPFDWNLSRINATSIFVHEEFMVPKSFSEFSNITVFNATVNGQPVSGRGLAIDPFSSDKALIIHYLLTKNDIIKLAEMKDVVGGSNNTMKFTLMPMGHASKQSSSDITTDFGAIHASLTWSPDPPRPGSETKLTLKFSDAQKDSSLNADVNYGLSIRSSDGKEIIRKDNLFALNGTGTVSLTIPASGVYQIEVDVKSLKYSGQTAPDGTRKGLARGFIVLP
jgi:hypothetical protein